MTDPETPSQQVSAATQDPDGRVNVTVNLTLPPWPSMPAPAPLPPPAALDPIPMPLPAPDPAPAVVEDPAPPVAAEDTSAPERGKIGKAMDVAYVRVDHALGKVFMELADDARRFYKTYRFWAFAAVGSLPDLYKLAIDNHVISGGPVPPPLEHIFNVIGFIGAASVVIKLKRKQQEDDS